MKLKIVVTIISLILILTQYSFTQYREPLFKVHDRGILWETVKDNGQIGGMFSAFEFFPSMDWPGGPAELPNKDEQRSYMQGAGIWLAGIKPNASIFFDEMGPFTYYDQGTYFEMEEEENFIGAEDFNLAEAEEKITAHWITPTGFHITRVSRAWSYPAFADFIIFEYIFVNETADDFTDVYIGFPYLLRPSYQDILAHGFWGDNLNVDDELVGYDEQRQLFYAYDFKPSFETDYDYGNYIEARGELRTTGYAGFAPLHYDETKDDASQPVNVLYIQTINNSHRLTGSSQTADKLYAILNGEDQSLQASEGEVLSPFMLEAFGLYDIGAGDSVKIVMVEAVNGIGLDLAVQGLDAQSKLPAGLDSLKNTIDRAQKLYDNDYTPEVLAPPSPNVEHFVLPSTQEIVLTWPPEFDDWEDPLTGAQDLEGYNVYRSDRSFNGPFEKLTRRPIRPARSSDRSRYFDNDLGEWKYKDNTVQVGVGYFYAVTSVDKDDNESGFTNRNTEALVTATQPAENTLNVSVFPNPFRLVSGLPTQGEESSIVFTNLPAKCKIKIYTTSGDLVRTLEHDNPNSGEEVWDQLSDSRQKTAAGVYLYTVESDAGHAKGTLVLIK